VYWSEGKCALCPEPAIAPNYTENSQDGSKLELSFFIFTPSKIEFEQLI